MRFIKKSRLRPSRKEKGGKGACFFFLYTGEEKRPLHTYYADSAARALGRGGEGMIYSSLSRGKEKGRTNHTKVRIRREKYFS